MSRVHIDFIRKRHAGERAVYEVISPDFSQTTTELEVIGELSIDIGEKRFSYEPVDKLRSVFCPPEYFEKYAGDYGKVSSVCSDSGLMCTTWSYFIYKKAKEIIDTGVFEEHGNTGSKNVVVDVGKG